MTPAQELRELARQIQELARQSHVQNIAWEQVCALVDYLMLRARVMELEHEGRTRHP